MSSARDALVMMEIGGEVAAAQLEGQLGGAPANLNISDVIDAISLADPSFGVAGVEGEMYRVSPPGAPPPTAGAPSHPTTTADRPRAPTVRILEQPAGKALRFRYECEGRSAGSIPGVNSTSEKKTYPTIEIAGYKGSAVVVVSCVNKDPENKKYRPHPHNLVGREKCKNGVCTMVVSGENPVVTFSNLGIQCVKRRDIGEALRLREEIRVDPFKTGFSHKSQPQSIELNAVRLCFQVFLQDRLAKITAALPPIVSDVIYDKKAMSDLNIARVSHCTGPATGGTEIILLCEKVNREDIAVVFFETSPEGHVVWEETANVLLVYKQVAIVAESPPYRDPKTNQHHQVNIQLKRLVDDSRSPPCSFMYIPNYKGTRAHKPLPDIGLLGLLVDKRPDPNNNNDPTVSSSSDSSANVSVESGCAQIADVNGSADVDDETVLERERNEKSLDELLDQVAELDEIYSENRTRLENATLHSNGDEDALDDFDDAGTYTSLQLAFKNPITIAEPEPLPYEDMPVHTYRGPIIEFSPLKRDTDDERAPPLPPKRVRKTSVDGFKTSQTSVDSILKPGRQLPVTRNHDDLRDKPALTVAKSEPALPPAPKKRSFLSRLFRRKEKSPAPSVKSEGKREKKEKRSKPVGRSVSSVSGQRPSKFKSAVSHTSLKDNASTTGLSYADSITHISLHGDAEDKSTSQTSLRRPASLAPLPPTDGDTILVAESVLALDASTFKKLQDDLELTDAEHYALYMAVAPHATVSEFDETSCYYSPVDGKPNSKKRKTISPYVETLYEQDRGFHVDKKEIKLEPKSDKTPPHQVSSPPQAFPQYQDLNYQRWAMQIENMQQGLPLGPGPSHMNPFVSQDMPWSGPDYAQSTSPNMQTLSPNVQGGVSPNMHSVTPNMQGCVSPNMHSVTPNMQGGMSPNMHSTSNMQVMSPNMQPRSPNMQPRSPNLQSRSPNMQQMTTNMQMMSPGMQVMSPHMPGVSPSYTTMSPEIQTLPSGMKIATLQTMNPMASNLHNLSPMQQGMLQGGLSPNHNMGHVSPNMVEVPANALRSNASQMLQQNAMDTLNNDSPSFSGLLDDRGEMAQLNSSEISGLVAMLENNQGDLSDSLNRLSTREPY